MTLVRTTWSRCTKASQILAVAASIIVGCGADPDDSGGRIEAVSPVAHIESSTGPLWLGAAPLTPSIDPARLEMASRSVVSVQAHGCGPVSHGTAFSIAPGLFIGAAHVAAGAAGVQIATFRTDGVEEGADTSSYPAEVVGFDPGSDLMLLRSEHDAPPIELDRGRLGAESVVLGHPAREALHASPARIEHYVTATGLWGDGNSRNVYVLAADVQTGQSGAPLIDRNGRAVGVTFAAVRGVDEVAFALSRSELLRFLRSREVDARVLYSGRTYVSADSSELSIVAVGDCEYHRTTSER